MRGMHWVNLRWSIKVCINVQYVLCKPQLVYGGLAHRTHMGLHLRRQVATKIFSMYWRSKVTF